MKIIVLYSLCKMYLISASNLLRIFHGQECETVTLLFIYSKALFEQIIDQHGAVILL